MATVLPGRAFNLPDGLMLATANKTILPIQDRYNRRAQGARVLAYGLLSPTSGRQTSRRRSTMVTSVSITITKAASTNMPANTPATSNTPSACWIRYPKPAADPIYSPTTAPTTAKPTEVCSEENIQDSADGQ